jgi:hypothetical protein
VHHRKQRHVGSRPAAEFIAGKAAQTELQAIQAAGFSR